MAHLISQETSTSGKPFRAVDLNKRQEEFRSYRAEARSSVKEFYRLNHAYQTLDFVREKKRHYFVRDKCQMGIWAALETLNQFVDDSDPDTDLPQIEHALQTSEAMRRDGRPDWFVLTGLIHDLGKVLCLWNESDWAVVGDTFPVGCAFSKKIVFPEFFAANPDSNNPLYRTANGIYEAGCGLGKVHFSWGHDEYLYRVVKEYLPEEALYMIRYHSAYVIHREGEYSHLMNEYDQKMIPSVHEFNRYDLYSKSQERPDPEALKPYYKDLIAKYFPSKISW